MMNVCADGVGVTIRYEWQNAFCVGQRHNTAVTGSFVHSHQLMLMQSTALISLRVSK